MDGWMGWMDRFNVSSKQNQVMIKVQLRSSISLMTYKQGISKSKTSIVEQVPLESSPCKHKQN